MSFRIGREIDRITAQNLDVQVVCRSLRQFREIAESATPKELKQIVPLFVERIEWHRDRVYLALYERQVQKEIFDPAHVNHLGGGAQERFEWLRTF